MSNPLRILTVLDKNLTQPAELNLFGRSAIALGYPNASATLHNTHDVDGILSLDWLKPSETHEDFWLAVQRTNVELESDGLYLTHLFREIDVILQPDWAMRRVRLHLALSRLTVYRPATIDLILTKMARGDEEDMADIAFLVCHDRITRDQLETAFTRARVPDVPEIQRLFQRAQSRVIALVEG